MVHKNSTRPVGCAEVGGRGRRVRRRGAVVVGGVLLALALTACAGCDTVSFLLGYAAGRIGSPPFQIVTVERICYQDGVQIECP